VGCSVKRVVFKSRDRITCICLCYQFGELVPKSIKLICLKIKISKEDKGNHLFDDEDF